VRERQNLRNARALRVSLTEPERRLWARLRRRQLNRLHFRHQAPIGPFIADFACAALRLVIELDGETHASAREADERRTSYLHKLGWRVLRFANGDVMTNIDGVLQRIIETVTSPLPDPPPQAGEGAAEPAPAKRGREGPVAPATGGRGRVPRT
jgi:very-short-patch-repair endonuclease